MLRKGCGFLFFARNTGKNIANNISKILISKYSKKLLDYAKQSAPNVLYKNMEKMFLVQKVMKHY